MTKNGKSNVIQCYDLIYRLYSIYGNCPNDILHTDGYVDGWIDRNMQRKIYFGIYITDHLLHLVVISNI